MNGPENRAADNPVDRSPGRRGVPEIAAGLAVLRGRIDGIDRRWTHAVEITAVTKAFEPSLVHDAAAAGCAVIGENYAQDLLSKSTVLDALAPHERPRVDFIGHLQSNKVRQITGLVDRWCTVDRASIAREIARRAPGADVLLQVNATGEETKGGCAPDAVRELHDLCMEIGLSVLGLLTIGPTGVAAGAAEPGFRRVRALVDEMGLDVCSMGMSNDLDVAVRCGSTNVRIGSMLFGPRPTSHERDDVGRGAVHQDGYGRG